MSIPTNRGLATLAAFEYTHGRRDILVGGERRPSQTDSLHIRTPSTRRLSCQILIRRCLSKTGVKMPWLLLYYGTATPRLAD